MRLRDASTIPGYTAAPVFSSDTGTTAHNTIEIEAGVAASDDDGIDSPVTIKWGATPATELFLGCSPYASIKTLGTRESGFGDVVARVRFLEERRTRPSAAVQLAPKLPTADDRTGLGSGETDEFAAGILTKTFDHTTVVWFYQLGVLGDPARPRVDLEHGAQLLLPIP